jgi:hypothetical protein
MWKVLVAVLSLSFFGISSQLAFAEAPTNCVTSNQRCRDQGVNHSVCDLRFGYCKKYNKNLGLNWYGLPLPPVQAGRMSLFGPTGGTSNLKSANSGATVGLVPTVSAPLNSPSTSSMSKPAAGGSGLFSGPGTPRLRAQ